MVVGREVRDACSPKATRLAVTGPLLAGCRRIELPFTLSPSQLRP